MEKNRNWISKKDNNKIKDIINPFHKGEDITCMETKFTIT
jgi:hypothetical protein